MGSQPQRVLPCFGEARTSPHFPHMVSAEAWGTHLNWLVPKTFLLTVVPLLPPAPTPLGAQLLHLSTPEETQL